MKITRMSPSPKFVKVKDVKAGETFVNNFDILFLKIRDVEIRGDPYNCIVLADGELEFYHDAENVEIVDSEIITRYR